MIEYLMFWFAKFLVEAGIFLLAIVAIALFVNWCERKR